jgi:hypothetical protein
MVICEDCCSCQAQLRHNCPASATQSRTYRTASTIMGGFESSRSARLRTGSTPPPAPSAARRRPATLFPTRPQRRRTWVRGSRSAAATPAHGARASAHRAPLNAAISQKGRGRAPAERVGGPRCRARRREQPAKRARQARGLAGQRRRRTARRRGPLGRRRAGQSRSPRRTRSVLARARPRRG